MKKYDSSNIKVYKGLDGVRKRPGMYIGDTEDGSGLHRMIFELVDNSVDEYLNGCCDYIKVILYKDGYVSIIDNGRGIPIDNYKDTNKSTAEIIMTVLHSGGKFDNDTYKISGGLHGVGLSVVNALSYHINLRIYKNGKIYSQNYKFGKPIDDLCVIDKSNFNGTEILFIPDYTIIKNTNFDYNLISKRLLELSFLNTNLKIEFFDLRIEHKKNIFYNTGGILSFLQHLNKDKEVINSDPIYFEYKINDVLIKLSLQWINSNTENIYCYTNNILQTDGGSHFTGFKNALTKAVKMYMEEFFFKKNSKILLQGEDIRNGITAVLCIYMPNPKFSSQTKEKLISLEIKSIIENFIMDKFKSFLYENPNFTKPILSKIYLAAKAREAAKNARNIIIKKGLSDNINLPGKLSDCQEKNPKFSEIFIVEGDSAGGSAKQARDRKTQAILPLKGKILNVEKSSKTKMLSNQEIRSLISALKCGVGIDDYDHEKLRYHKVILMTDADIDGAHIRTLLLTFFYRYMPKLLENGNIFLSKPPLFKFKSSNEFFYVKDKNDLDRILVDKMLNVILKYNSFLPRSQLEIIIHLTQDIYYNINKLSKKYPEVFLKSLISFKYIKLFRNISLFINKYNELSKNFIFLSKIKLIFDKNKDCIVNIKNNNLQSSFIIEKTFFLSEEFYKIRKLNLFLHRIFKKNKQISFNKSFYDINKFSIFIEDIKLSILTKYNIQRYKGLGEMNPNQLWETSMNPKSRYIEQINIKNIFKTNSLISNLMGESIDERKKIIDNSSDLSLDLDI
jgi:DNA gyrase subunit B